MLLRMPIWWQSVTFDGSEDEKVRYLGFCVGKHNSTLQRGIGPSLTFRVKFDFKSDLR